MEILESILHNSGVINEASKTADFKKKVRTSVLRVIATGKNTGADLEENLKKLSDRFGVLITTEYKKNPEKGYFFVDKQILDLGDEESFVEYIS